MSRQQAKERLGAFTAMAMAWNTDKTSREQWVRRLNRSVGWE